MTIKNFSLKRRQLFETQKSICPHESHNQRPASLVSYTSLATAVTRRWNLPRANWILITSYKAVGSLIRKQYPLNIEGLDEQTLSTGNHEFVQQQR